jgi:S-adenosylmethionine:tRNA ribosyltransferase-isomerase
MKTALFDYALPKDLIAQEPVEPRDSSRLLVLSRQDGSIKHRVFRDIKNYLKPGDCLVLNDTQVIPARLKGRRETGGQIELLLLRPRESSVWECLVKPGRRVREGNWLVFKGGVLEGEVVGRTKAGTRLIHFHFDGDFWECLSEVGEVPLPPYIKKPLKESGRYQTVYALKKGSAAAPTAGLHFTPELLEAVKRTGVRLAYVTLHTGLDTFRPIREEEVEEHPMHQEFFSLSEESASLINQTLKSSARVVAVGTTSVRVLETQARGGLVASGEGFTELYIYPGYKFQIVNALLTNFHLPRTTLLVLVSAFASRELILKAYEAAIREKYRFYSFGDAMLIL